MPLKAPDTILNGPHLALFAGAFISIASAVIVMLGSVALRHFALGNVVVAIVTFGTSAVNAVAQLIMLGIIYVSVATHPESKSLNDVRFVDGKFDTNGRQFTHETWACMMGNLYLTQEPWSTNACSEYHYARYLTIIMSVAGAMIVGVAYWPVRPVLFMDSKNVADGKA
ncbi:hypothetical protein K505DRAFT_248398 [Melanomma pulvis-pyrius CBS 109.77]|uniref:MARVEL domain-containing protein n=1 Tax=Melanomma pulvis-pyrius CBS 109.77 TaxID=1314802 RepID=A0A6A6X6A9_9PLEO|nr:hypothetical protein K505DRAFT_248398 [Melanomma pulvis-pyrius CBS 109.77]